MWVIVRCASAAKSFRGALRNGPSVHIAVLDALKALCLGDLTASIMVAVEEADEVIYCLAQSCRNLFAVLTEDSDFCVLLARAGAVRAACRGPPVCVVCASLGTRARV